MCQPCVVLCLPAWTLHKAAHKPKGGDGQTDLLQAETFRKDEAEDILAECDGDCGFPTDGPCAFAPSSPSSRARLIPLIASQSDHGRIATVSGLATATRRSAERAAGRLAEQPARPWTGGAEAEADVDVNVDVDVSQGATTHTDCLVCVCMNLASRYKQA